MGPNQLGTEDTKMNKTRILLQVVYISIMSIAMKQMVRLQGISKWDILWDHKGENISCCRCQKESIYGRPQTEKNELER